ncbi:MAG: AAA family ATPase [Deltaproteobacteria bacterium]|nr:AAA family ATPase [Deltaproteobacteria bacterium]
MRQIFHHHWTTSPPGLRALDAALPQRLSATVARLTARSPRQRPRSARQIVAELDHWSLPTVSGTLPPESPHPFRTLGPPVGRETARQALLAALGDATSGRGALVVLSGEAGMGRRTLRQDLAGVWESARALVLGTEAPNGEFTPPFSLPLELLEHLIRQWPWLGETRQQELTERLRAAVGDNGDLLESLLPGLGPLVKTVGASAPLPRDRRRLRALEVLCGAVLSLGTPPSPLVVWLHGVQGTDGDSVEWLRHLAHRMRKHAVMIVLDLVPDPHRSSRLAAWLETLPRGEGVHWVEMPPLNESQAGTLVGGLLGVTLGGGEEASPDATAARLARWLVGAYGGRPLAIEAALRVLRAKGWLTPAPLGEPGPAWRVALDQARAAPWPDSLSGLLRLRLDAIPRDVLALLQAAAVLPGPFRMEHLGPLVEHFPPPRRLELVEDAVAAGLLVWRGDWLHLSHPVWRASLLGTLTPPQRAHLHHRASSGSGDRTGRVPLRHHHQAALHAQEAGEVSALVEHGLRAARAAGAVQALQGLAEWSGRVFPALAQDARLNALMVAGGAAETLLGRHEQAAATLSAAQALPLSPEEGLEVLRLSAWLAREQGQPEEALTWVEQALQLGGESLPESPVGSALARLTAAARRRYESLRQTAEGKPPSPIPPPTERIAEVLELAAELTARESPQRAVLADEKVLSLAGSYAPSPVLLRALIRLAAAEGDPEGLAFREARALLNHNPFPHEEARWYLALGRCQMEALLLDRALESLERAEALFRLQGDLRGEAETLVQRSHLALHSGSVAALETLSGRLNDLARLLEWPELEPWSWGLEALVAGLSGRVSVIQAGQGVREAATRAAAREDGPTARHLLAWNALLALGTNDLSEVLNSLSHAAAVPESTQGLGGLMFLALEAEAHLVQAAAFPGEAAHHLARSARLLEAPRGEPALPLWLDPPRFRLEVMANLLSGGEHPDLEQRAKTEVQRLERLGGLLDRARLCQRMAEGLKRGGAASWEAWADQAHAAYVTLGLHPFAAAVERLFPEAALEPASPRHPALPTHPAHFLRTTLGGTEPGVEGFLSMLEHMGLDGPLPVESLHAQVLTVFLRATGAAHVALFLPNADGQLVLALQRPEPSPRGDWINRWLVDEAWRERTARFRAQVPELNRSGVNAPGDRPPLAPITLTCLPLLEQGRPRAVASLGHEGLPQGDENARLAAWMELGRQAAAVLALNAMLILREQDREQWRATAERRARLLEWSRYATRATTTGALLQAYVDLVSAEREVSHAVLLEQAHTEGEPSPLQPVAWYRTGGAGGGLDVQALPGIPLDAGQAALALQTHRMTPARGVNTAPNPAELVLLKTLGGGEAAWLPVIHDGDSVGALLLTGAGLALPEDSAEAQPRISAIQESTDSKAGPPPEQEPREAFFLEPLQLLTPALLRALEEQKQEGVRDALRRRLERVEQENAHLRRFVPSTMTSGDNISQGGEGETGLESGRERTLPVLSGELAGLAPLFELPAQAQLENLRGYFTRVEQALSLHHGQLHGAFNEQWTALFQRGAESALWGAQTLFQMLQDYREDQALRNRPAMITGLGLHLGDTLIGTIAAGERLNPLMAGEGVRTASRLAALCLDLRCGVLVSESMVESLERQAAFDLRPLGLLRRSPGEERVSVHELFSVREPDVVEKMRGMREVWEEALFHQQHGHWAEAVEGYRRYLAELPDDRAARQFLRLCRQRMEGSSKE